MYVTERGIEELESRRGDEEVTVVWLAEQLRTLNLEFETPIERFATWLARDDDIDDSTRFNPCVTTRSGTPSARH